MNATTDAWSFQRELEFLVPHQVALRDLDVEGLRLALSLTGDRFTAEGPHTLRIERNGRRGSVRAAVLDLRTLCWRATESHEHGVGILELATWLRRRDLLGTNCMLQVAIAALRARP